VVNWTVRAQRQLRIALAEALCRQHHARGDILGTTMQQLSQVLANTFPDAADVVVQDQFLGFRRKEHHHILLVELLGPERPGPYVVKIGPVAALQSELDGWNRCRPFGLRNDLVFLPLREGWRGPEPKDTDEPWLMSLIYGDAQQFIGVETTSTLEAAVVQAVLHGSPSVQSIGFVLMELFERIGHLLYSQSFVEDPASPSYAFEMHALERSMNLWETEHEARAVRRNVNSLASSGIGKFLDPIDYLRHGQARVADVVPRMLRGCAHGDLHGRNVLVGIVAGRALWPTVFDYEDMSPCNLLGWDFVKLETELKIRAQAECFAGGSVSSYVRAVQEFEIGLNAATEKCHQDRAWPSPAESNQPAERLQAILLEIRRLASLHLGANRGRPNEWLEEYYFLLGCYGVTTIRFSNLQPRERLAALLSAGVAASRLSWPRRADATADFSYHRALAAAKQRTRAGNKVDLDDAIDQLRGLRARYPHVLDIGNELVLALMEAQRDADAEAALTQLDAEFQPLDEEFLCRWGRFYKEHGDRHDVNANTASAYYRQALAKYRQAYAVRQGHFPGINVAAVLHLLAALDSGQAGQYRHEAEGMAQALLARRADWPIDQADDISIWHPATEAEARLLLGEWDRSAALYRQVLAVADLPPFARASMRRQVERIVQSFQRLGTSAMGPFNDIDALFTPLAA